MHRVNVEQEHQKSPPCDRGRSATSVASVIAYFDTRGHGVDQQKPTAADVAAAAEAEVDDISATKIYMNITNDIMQPVKSDGKRHRNNTRRHVQMSSSPVKAELEVWTKDSGDATASGITEGLYMSLTNECGGTNEREETEGHYQCLVVHAPAIGGDDAGEVSGVGRASEPLFVSPRFLSCIALWMFGFVFGIVAFILDAVARRRVRSLNIYGNKKKAVALQRASYIVSAVGIIIFWLATVTAVIFLVTRSFNSREPPPPRCEQFNVDGKCLQLSMTWIWSAAICESMPGAWFYDAGVCRNKAGNTSTSAVVPTSTKRTVSTTKTTAPASTTKTTVTQTSTKRTITVPSSTSRTTVVTQTSTTRASASPISATRTTTIQTPYRPNTRAAVSPTLAIKSAASQIPSTSTRTTTTPTSSIRTTVTSKSTTRTAFIPSSSTKTIPTTSKSTTLAKSVSRSTASLSSTTRPATIKILSSLAANSTTTTPKSLTIKTPVIPISTVKTNSASTTTTKSTVKTSVTTTTTIAGIRTTQKSASMTIATPSSTAKTSVVLQISSTTRTTARSSETKSAATTQKSANGSTTVPKSTTFIPTSNNKTIPTTPKSTTLITASPTPVSRLNF